MDLDLTIPTPLGPRDVTVSAPASAPLADVVAAVAAAAGIPTPAGAPATGTLGDGELRAGSVLTGAAVVEPAGVLALRVVAGAGAGRSFPLFRGRLVVGRDPECDIVLTDPDASRRHAELRVGAGEVTIRDLGSTNGTSIDGEPVADDARPLPRGARIRIGDCLLTLAATAEAPARLRPGPDGTRRVPRPPRPRAPNDADEVVFPAREEASRPGRVQWAAALVPGVAGGALAWWSGSPQFLLFALLSPVMLLSTALGDRLHWRRSRRRGAAQHRRALAQAEAAVVAGLAVETRRRWAAAPDPAAVYRTATLPGERLWSRRPGDPDGLVVRVGVGEQPSRLTVRAGTSTRAAGRLPTVPVEVDLRRGPLGLAGPPDVVDAVARWVVAQLAVHHSPAEVELSFLLDETRSAEWAWARWLPHVGLRVARSSAEWADAVAGCAATVESRRAAARGGAVGWAGPWLVLVVDRAAEFAQLPGLAEVLRDGPAVGVTAVCVETESGRWPGACQALARVRGETGSRLAVRAEPEACESEAIADQVPVDWAENVARSLASCRDDGGTAPRLPARVGLLTALALPAPSAAEIAQRWADSDGGARAVLGAGPDGPLAIGLAADGPHALVAGTTGAGKSELLQALVGSLAANHRPEDVSFLLIDYKGGAAFSDCAELPHVAGLVTDLDPYLTERALRSLDAELRRRERLLAAAGSAELAGYRVAGAEEPLPRLVIVVDEFATLAAELPEFVRGLVSVAQRGRSLGVHLVLATQRPGSAVSPEIRANTALRFCLRVTDPAESTDVLGSPESAALDRSTPGRAYLRAGSTLTAFQAAFASGRSPDPEAIVAEPLGPWRRHRPPAEGGSGSDLARLVGAVKAAARAGHRRPVRPPWTPPLPERLTRSDLGPPSRPAAVPLARIDRPDEQRCDVLEFDLAAGDSLLIAGTNRSGRTQALTALAFGAAAQRPATELALYAVDPAGALADAVAALPHLATLLRGDGLGLLPRLLTRLRDGAGPPGLLLVDGWDRLAATLSDPEVADCAELLTQLLRAGPAAGLAVAVSGDRSTLLPRFSGGFARRILLRQADRTDFGLAGIPARAVPHRFTPGRGVSAEDGALLQLIEAEPPAPEPMAGPTVTAPDGRVVLRPLPATVRLAELPRPAAGLVIGAAGDRGEPLVFDPFAGAGRLVVAGPPRSGRSTLLCSLLRQAEAAGLATVVAAPSRSPLAASRTGRSGPVLEPASPDPGPPPSRPTLLLVDDCEAFGDDAVGERLADWLRAGSAPVAAVVAGRADDLATSYRGLGAAARRSQCGLLLRPGPVDGELLGVRLPRRPASGPPGRGVLVGDPAWGPPFTTGDPVPVQVALP